MPDKWGLAAMGHVNDPGNTTQDAFTVVVNDAGQFSLWPASADLPDGWRRRSDAMSRSACLDTITGAWQDITPARVRAAVRGPAGSARNGSARDGAGRQDRVPPRPAARFVHERFASQACRRPGAVAVVAAGTELTYGELDSSANRLARCLMDLGAGPETLIGVHAERGADAIRSLLAIMKAGSGYLPLDPSLPTARLARICADANPIVILTDRPGKESLPGGTRVLALGELAAGLERWPFTAPEVSLHPDHLCYAIHTSGSTGEPKAVAVSHGSLACVITALRSSYRITARDRVVQLAALAFDTSLEQILVTLASGATLLLPPAGTIAPADLLGYLEHEQVTVIDLTPAYWHRLLAATEPDDARLRSVRLMITGGEMADPSDCDALRQTAPRARLLNAYGLTETTITSALFDVSASGRPGGPVPAGPVPVGQAIGPARIMVLDEALRPVPPGSAGEIYIGGCGVARGYLGRGALTAERFLPDGSGAPGSRMYRTGDLGRYRQDGTLEVTGRADRQLKVRGFRVDPAEIESVLAGHPDIGQVAVVATRDRPGDTRLAAYYTCRPGGATPRDPSDPGGESSPPDPSDLRRFLGERLPGYMIPAVFVALDQMPATPEGEPARDALEPPATPPARLDQAFSRTPVQAGLTYLWSELLKIDHVGLDDDFFALGGNSLLAAEMLAHARIMFGISADYVRPLTRSLLRDPTMRAFAQATQDARAGRLAVPGGEKPVDFAREAELSATGRQHARPDPRYGPPDWRTPREILLTGSTGFFGAYLLSELLAATTARVWCLVRASDAAQAMARITDAAARYELPDLPPDRVVPLPGDLASPRLGLSPAQFCELAQRVDVIYHAGAAVNFIYPYEELRAANVTGTREVIRLAAEARGIPVHYVSTTAVLAGLGVMGVREVTEETPLAHPDRLGVGYVETKFVAEELLRNAVRAGLPVAIYRPLDVVGSLGTGVWNTAAEMCALIRFVTDTGLAPDIDLPLDFVPADVCAAAVRHISLASFAGGGTYHLASPEPALLGFLVDRLRVFGFSVSEIPYDAWVSELLRYAAQHPSHPMTPFLPLFIDRDQETGLTPAEMYFEHTFPHYTRSNTERALAGSGIVFPPVDRRLIDGNIGRLIEQGYLRAPRDIRRAAQRAAGQAPDRPGHAG
jgi:amino acid adenylation domain-containing protein/thioester reductase-like protein